LISTAFKQNAPYDRYPSARNFRQRMSRFPGRYCIKEYKTILFCKKKTPAGGNHPGRPDSNSWPTDAAT
jgi:hypothetical protein